MSAASQLQHHAGQRHDGLRRPLELFVTKDTDPEILAEHTVWGEGHVDAVAKNLRGQPYQRYDGAGVVTSETYDFKGNLLASSRRLRSAYATQVDWPFVGLTDLEDIIDAAEPLLELETFESSTAYDALNRPTSLTTPDASEIRPTYNEAGLLEAVDVRLRGGATWTGVVDDIDYDAKGQRERIVYANGTRTAYTYDPLTFRLTRLKTTRDGDSAVLQDLRYTYDPIGNILAIEDAAQQTIFFDNAVVTPSALYEYDPVYRLTEATGREHAGGLGDDQRDENDLPLNNLPHANNTQALRNYTEGYAYDKVGNILQMIHDAGGPVGSWTRGYRVAEDSNRLEATSLQGDDLEDPESYSAEYTHDAHGNMVAMPHLAEMGWDFKDQMVYADKGGGGEVYFTYDAAGQRVRKVWEHAGLIEERIYLGGWELYRRRVASSGVLELERETLHLMDGAKRVVMVETKTVDTSDPMLVVTPRFRYQLGNHLGSALLEVDETGSVISYEEYHPYGTTAYRSGRSGVEVSAKRYRYTGKERDEETGLYYHGARYYASWLGRWTAADPAGMVDGANLYAYVRGSPVGLVDPSGRDSFDPERLLETNRRDSLGDHYAFKPDSISANVSVREGTTTVEHITPQGAEVHNRPVREGTTTVEHVQPSQSENKTEVSSAEAPSEKVALLPFFLRIPTQYLRTQQTLPRGGPAGLTVLRQLNAGSTAAVVNFSRDIAPGTAVENLTLGIVEAMGAAATGIAAAAKVQRVTPLLRALPNAQGVTDVVVEGQIATPYGPAVQSGSVATAEARAAAQQGATLYRGGVLGRSAGPEAQFWSLENPLSPGYAAKYGIPTETVAFDFVETATLRPGASFITREAPGLGTNAGGAIEVVVYPGSIVMRGFFMP